MTRAEQEYTAPTQVPIPIFCLNCLPGRTCASDSTPCTPFTLRRIPPAKVKPPKPHHLFNYPKYRCHRGFSFGIDCLTLSGSQSMCHRCHSIGILWAWGRCPESFIPGKLVSLPARRFIRYVDLWIAFSVGLCSPAEHHTAMTWAQRLKRVFNIENEICARCGGSVRVIACIED